MDTLLEQAKLRRNKLKLELSALDDFIFRYEMVKEAGVQLSETTDLFSGAATRKAKAGLVEKQLEVAREAMIEAKRPLNRREIYDAVVQAGLEVIGGDKLKVLGTNVWRSGKFVRAGKAGYWPKGVNAPQGYERLIGE